MLLMEIPASNWGILGHEWAVSLLREHTAHGRLRHAYLITGPQGVGRRTLALRLAQSINCSQPPVPGEPCRACRNCAQIERMQHPDVSIIQAEHEGGTLKVDQVREAQHSLALAPYEARYRVAIFLRFEEAHLSAANALLKTLEEPPPQVILILTAADTESLLPTIVSRCEILRLRPLPLEFAAQGLSQGWDIPIEQAHLLAHISGGRPGHALGLHAQPDRLAQRTAWLNDLIEMLPASRVQRFAYIESLIKDKDQSKNNLRQMILAWLPLWRDVMLRRAGARAALGNPDRQADIERLAQGIDLATTRQVMVALEHTLELLDKNVNTRLAAEVLMLDLPHIS